MTPEGQSTRITSFHWWPKVDVCTRVLEQSRHMGIAYLSRTALNYSHRLLLFYDQELLVWKANLPEISFGEEFHNWWYFALRIVLFVLFSFCFSKISSEDISSYLQLMPQSISLGFLWLHGLLPHPSSAILYSELKNRSIPSLCLHKCSAAPLNTLSFVPCKF